jgi:hypothetical protein
MLPVPGPSQELADAAREAGVEILRYHSARDPDAVAVLTCGGFAETHPHNLET